MRLKRAFLTAIVLSVGLLLVADSGVLDWTTPALADLRDDANGGDVLAIATHQDGTDVEAQHQGNRRCSERPNPKKCRRRRHGQERKRQGGGDGRGGGGGSDQGNAPPPSSAPGRAPEEPCVLPDLEDVPPYGPYLCDVYRDLTPVFP